MVSETRVLRRSPAEATAKCTGPFEMPVRPESHPQMSLSPAEAKRPSINPHFNRYAVSVCIPAPSNHCMKGSCKDLALKSDSNMIPEGEESSSLVGMFDLKLKVREIKICTQSYGRRVRGRWSMFLAMEKEFTTSLRLKHVKHAATVIIGSNAIILTKPLQVLAETCEADNSVFNMNMPLLLSFSLIGATVGALRRQAKIESYATGLSYFHVSGRIVENEVIVESRKHDVISHLKNGKNFLRNQNPEKAFLSSR
ncbi:hypothetical protein ACS0TY_035397 [Phlomoides rotata]